MIAEIIMKNKVLASAFTNRDGLMFRFFVVCFLTASLLATFRIANAAMPTSSGTSASTTENNKTPEQPIANKEAMSYTAKRNMSVEDLIKEVYLGTPLNNQTLIQALFEANPKVLNGKPAQSIKRSQVVNIPDHATLVLKILTPYSPLPSAAATEAVQQGSLSSDQLARRLWVRFP
jgi:hypothetical protein